MKKLFVYSLLGLTLITQRGLEKDYNNGDARLNILKILNKVLLSICATATCGRADK